MSSDENRFLPPHPHSHTAYPHGAFPLGILVLTSSLAARHRYRHRKLTDWLAPTPPLRCDPHSHIPVASFPPHGCRTRRARFLRLPRSSPLSNPLPPTHTPPSTARPTYTPPSPHHHHLPHLLHNYTHTPPPPHLVLASPHQHPQHLNHTVIGRRRWCRGGRGGMVTLVMVVARSARGWFHVGQSVVVVHLPLRTTVRECFD